MVLNIWEESDRTRATKWMFNHNSISIGKHCLSQQPSAELKEVEIIWKVAKTMSTTNRIPVSRASWNKILRLDCHSIFWLVCSFVWLGPLIYSISCYIAMKCHCVCVLLWMEWKPIGKMENGMKWKEMKRFVIQSWVSFVKLKFISSAFPVLKIQKQKIWITSSRFGEIT